MKKFRHALSFLLVFVMLFSTSVPALSLIHIYNGPWFIIAPSPNGACQLLINNLATTGINAIANPPSMPHHAPCLLYTSFANVFVRREPEYKILA